MATTHGPSHAARLFKTLVLAGASLGVSSCGGESYRTVDGSGGASPEGGQGGMGGMAGTAGSIAGGAGTAAAGTAGSAGSAGAAGHVDACVHAAQRVCLCDYQPAILQTCTLNHPYGYYGPNAGYRLTRMDCECEASRPTGPLDCAHTQQFTCLKYDPEYEACYCNEAAPLDKDDCENSSYMQCVREDPRIGCDCIWRIG
jgi:hypothetical protein